MREPIEVHIRLTSDDEVLALRTKVAELEAALETERAIRHQAEFKYGCEVRINAELVDLCRASGVKFRSSLMGRPFDREPAREGGQ